MKENKREKTLLQEVMAMKVRTRYSADLERTVTRQETGRSVQMIANR